jgi:hypothetical protein
LGKIDSIRRSNYHQAMTHKSRTTIRLPQSLKNAVRDFAAKEGVSVSRYIARAIVEKIGARGATEFFAERGENGDVARAIEFLEGRPKSGPKRGNQA